MPTQVDCMTGWALASTKLGSSWISTWPWALTSPTKLNNESARCKVLVAVIGRSWLEVKDGEGRRRLDDPKDWVRLEIVAALERNVPVIPALVGGAKMPLASDLPDPLSKLTRRQAIEITHSGFHSDVDRLIRGLEKISAPGGEKI